MKIPALRRQPAQQRVEVFQPAGDQPNAIAQLTEGINDGEPQQVLLGGALVTGALLANEWLGWRERAGHYHIETLEVDAGDKR